MFQVIYFRIFFGPLFDDFKHSRGHGCVLLHFCSQLLNIIVRLWFPVEDFVKFQENARTLVRVAEKVFLVAFVLLCAGVFLLRGPQRCDWEGANFIFSRAAVKVAVDGFRARFACLVSCFNQFDSQK